MSVVEHYFAEKLRSDTIIHRGLSCAYDTTYNKPSWFSFDFNDAKEYGSQIHTFKTKRELKLINLQSLLFHMDFTDRINKKYGVGDQTGMLALASIGLPSLKAQQAVLTHQPGECGNPRAKSIIDAEYYNGSHRYSFKIGDEMVDTYLVNELIEFYPNFDGYIIPRDWPSCFHSGFFHKEICLFKPRNLIVSLNSIKIKGGSSKRKQKGSGCGDPRNDVSTDQWNRLRKRSMRSIGWTGPELYDEDGLLRMPTLDEIMRFRQLSLQSDLPPELLDSILQSRRQSGTLTPNYDANYFDTVEYVN